jgi:MFS family permease
VSSGPSGVSEAPGAFRWSILVACSLAMFGAYYVFDALAPATPLLQAQLGLTDEQVGLLDTAYNVAALLTLVAGGILIDRLGTRRSVVLFAGIGAAGGLLIAVLPATFPSRPAAAMMAGRFVLGVGSELFFVAATTVVGRWFKGKEISFAMALQVLIGRQGSYVADRSPDWFGFLFAGHHWQTPLLFAAALGGTWFAFSLIYGRLEAIAARRYPVRRTGPTDKIVLADLVRFDASYWWIVGLCVAFYATIFPFRSFANLYFTQAHHVSLAEAGALKSWLPLISMVGMPLFGLLVDRIGRRSLMMAVGSALLVPPFLLMPYSSLPLTVSVALLGLAFAVVPAVIWPSVTYLVAEERLGSAYALMTFGQQLGWAAMSWGLGLANDVSRASAENPGGWVPAMWMLASLASVGFLFSFLLWRSERGASGHGLDEVKPAGVS